MKRIVCLLVFLAAAGWQLWILNVPPSPVPASASPTTFSAERARADLREITLEPHPLGTSAHARVREYLVQRLQALGLEPEIQTHAMSRQFGDALRIATVRNIVARLPGEGPERGSAILLMSHYDSVPGSPGATDAGNGVAAILETLRALQAGPPLERDVIVLISDGEELGLLGAQAFVEHHAWADDIGWVLNFEGRGYTGPVSMFRTVGPAGGMVDQLGALSGRVTATSVTDAVFRIMPNDTDLTLFGGQGIAGLDFANAHGLTHYHQPLDSFANAAPGSLQHHGDHALGLVRLLAEPEPSNAGPVPVYFTLPALGLVQISILWAQILAVLAALAAVASLLHWIRQGNNGLKTIGRDILAWALPMASTMLVAWLGLQAILPLLVETGWYFHDAPHHSGWYLAGLMLLGFGCGLWVRQRFFGRLDPTGPLLSLAVIWSVSGIWSAFALPGVSFVFWLPVLLTLGLHRLLREEQTTGAFRLIVGTVLSMLLLCLILPLINLIEIMLTLNLVYLCAALLWLLFVFIQPWLRAVLPTASPGTGLRISLTGIAVIGVLVVLNNTVWDFAKPTSVGYAWLEDGSGEGESYWYSREGDLDAYMKSYLGESPERGSLPDWGLRAERWLAPTEPIRTDAPDLSRTGDGWTLNYPADSYYVELDFEQLLAGGMQIDDQAVPEGIRNIQWYGPPNGGVTIAGLANATSDDEFRTAAVVLGVPGDRQQESGLMHKADITYLASRHSLP